MIQVHRQLRQEGKAAQFEGVFGAFGRRIGRLVGDPGRIADVKPGFSGRGDEPRFPAVAGGFNKVNPLGTLCIGNNPSAQ
jgi:hypothetical protein